jgi:hypothetical protein
MVGVFVTVLVAVGVKVKVGVGVSVGVSVGGTVPEGVAVGVSVMVGVEVTVGDRVGVGVLQDPVTLRETMFEVTGDIESAPMVNWFVMGPGQATCPHQVRKEDCPKKVPGKLQLKEGAEVAVTALEPK